MRTRASRTLLPELTSTELRMRDLERFNGRSA
jgi:hypothetical protein